MECENCKCDHNGSYGSGRFCSSKCARGFSTKEKRQEINERVSQALTGRLINYHRFTSEEIAAKWKNPEYVMKVAAGQRKFNERRLVEMHSKPIEEWTKSERRKFLLEDVEFRCSVCGYEKVHPVTKTAPLEIHHIDGDNKNNVRENLIVVCLNCHFMIDDKYRFRGRGKHSKS